MSYAWIKPIFIGVVVSCVWTAQWANADFSMPVEVAAVRTDTLVISVDTVGNLRGNEAVVIRPEVTGMVEKIHFKEGSSVAKNALLISLDDRIWQAELQQAQANLRLSQVNFKRAEELRKKGVLAQQAYDEAMAELRVARATVELAKTRLTKTKIKAPFAGIVGLREVSVGDYVLQGDAIVTLQDPNPIKVDFSIPETSVPLLRDDQTLEIRVDALPDQQFTGKVYAVDSQLDINGRSIAIRATVPNEDNTLRAGYFARVRLIVERRDNALMIPEDAIVPQGNENFVFLVKDDGTVDLAQITTGIRRRGEVEVLAGLNVGQLVVTAGQLKLRPGTPVAFEQPNSEAVTQ